MFGFLVGTACLIALIKTLRWHGGCGGHGHFHHGMWSRHGGHWAPRMMLRGLFVRLQTSPSQEKVILEQFDSVRSAFEKARDDLKATRSDVASAFRGENLDDLSFNNIFVKHEAAIDPARRAIVEALTKIHEALDERQRAIVATLIESGPRGMRGDGGCGWHGHHGCRPEVI